MLVFALLLLVVGALILGGVAQLTATQSFASEGEWESAQRRIILENSRAMARQYWRTRMFLGSAPASAAVTNALGGFNLTPAITNGYWVTVSETNTNARLNINPFTVMERGGFYRVWVAGTLWDGSTNASGDVGWNMQIRTRSPIAAGYCFVRQRPSVAALGELADPPYIDFQQSQRFFGYNGMPLMPVSSVTNTNGSDTNGFGGFLDVPIGASAFSIFTNVTFQPRVTNVDMQVVVDLGGWNFSTSTNPVARYDVPATTLFTNATNGVLNLPVRTVIIRGSLLGGFFDSVPVHVVVDTNNTNVQTLILSNNNTRRVYFNRMKATNDGQIFNVASVNASFWRLGITVSKSAIEFEVGNLDIQGGLRTDAGTSFQAGTAFFSPENDPQGLDYIGDRMMWLEDNRAL